jgi:hypothetical protein
MSNEPKQSGGDSEWTMPEPIFRSSDGHDLRSVLARAENSVGSEDVTEVPENKMENESKQAAATGPQIEGAIEMETKGDKLGMSMTAVGLLALLGAGVIFLLFYFLFFRQAIPETP